MTSPQTTDDLLVTALHLLRCDALAFVSPTREVKLLCTPGIEEADIRIVIKRVATAFTLECEDRHDSFVRNRVRASSEGPLIGRFLVSPVRDDDEKLLGVLIGFNQPDRDELSSRETRIAARYSRLMAASMSASRDALTGLLLPAAFEKQVAAHRRSAADATNGSILYGNVDQLGTCNELWGLDTGDKVLHAISQQLQAIHSVHADAVIARLSGDRFAIFLPRISVNEARSEADSLRKNLAEIRIPTAVEPIAPRMSWGVTALRSARHGLGQSLAAAEAACKVAKQRGGNRTEIAPEGDIGQARRNDDLMIANRLRVALDAGHFEVLGQPINSLLKQEDERRYEMLVRIMDDEERLISPAQFMPAATRYQMLPKLDRCVISHVLTRLQEAAGKPGFIPLHASFNLSAPTISDASFVDWLFAQVAASGIPGQWLTFELSEAAAFVNLANTHLLMQRLGNMGCRFALDNFGAGTSPLGNLRNLNFSSIKIDSSLVRDLLTDTRAASMVKAIANLANTLGLEIVAEHVETSAICMRLIEMQVQFGQGYAIGKPTRLDRILNPFAQPLAKAG